MKKTRIPVCYYGSGRKYDPGCKNPATRVIIRITAYEKSNWLIYACDEHIAEMMRRADKAGIAFVVDRI